MTQQVVTANRLGDGLVVYLTADGGWSEALAAAAIVGDEQASAALLAEGEAAAAAQRVVEPYLIDVVPATGGFVPARYRELIRATGPSTETDPAAATAAPVGAPGE